MKIYLGAGSNLGDRRANLTRALELLTERGARSLRISPVVESPALLLDAAPPDWNRPFLNLVVECETDASPEQLLRELKAIETELGRDATARWAPRPIDLDILLWGSETIATERLRVPHSGLHERAFVLAPLAALRPRLQIPGHGGKTVLELARALDEHIPLWMGIVNVTPDSFSDGGEASEPRSFNARVEQHAESGAHMIDVGAESTRPGAALLSPDGEWSRLEPVLGPLLDALRGTLLRPLISIDTYHPETARRAISLGVDIINDVGGLSMPEMIELAADSDCHWIAMHSLGMPANPAVTLPSDEDPVDGVSRWLELRIVEWERAGIDLERVSFDPGVGFGKSPLQSLRLLRGVRRFERFGLRVLVGHSRKSFMHRFSGNDKSERDLVTVGASLALARAHVDVLRVHNVAAHVTALRGAAHVR